MIGKRLTVGLLAALLVVSVIGASGVPASVLATDGSDGNDSRTTATAIDVGQTATGTIEQGDVDWHAVEVEAGQSIFANLTLTTENEEDLKFELFDPDGERIGEGPADAMVGGYHTMRIITGGTATGGDVAEQSGTYYVRVQPVGDDFSEPTNYELTVETDDLDQYDPNEQPNTATRIDPDATISGVLSGSDRDTYAIDLEQGETITVTATYDGSFTPSTYLVGPNASDVTLDSYYDTDYALAYESIGRDHEVTYTARTTGTHFLRVNPNLDSTIKTFDEKASYEISVDVSGEDDDSDSTGEETETPNETDSENATDDSTENEDEKTDENESTESVPDSDDSEETETGEETGSNESSDGSNQTDGTEDDTSDDTATNTEDVDRTECDEERTSNASECEEPDASAEQPDCEETNE